MGDDDDGSIIEGAIQKRKGGECRLHFPFMQENS